MKMIISPRRSIIFFFHKIEKMFYEKRIGFLLHVLVIDKTIFLMDFSVFLMDKNIKASFLDGQYHQERVFDEMF